MKILAVCGFGVGSSMVLKMTIEKVLRGLGIDAEVENTDISTAQGTKCDFILTSNELAENLRTVVSVPVYPIKKYMDVVEVKSAIETFISTK